DGLSAAELREVLADRELALTTVHTVLSRLEKKGFVTRDRSVRPHRYLAVATREEHVAELMTAMLSQAPGRHAVLARALGTVSVAHAMALRSLLGRNVSTLSCSGSGAPMPSLGLVLAVLACLLAWPIPAALARFRGDPTSEVVLWQAVGLSGGLSLIGAALAFAVAPGSTSLPQGILALLRGQTHTQLSVIAWIFLVIALLLIG